MCIGPECINAFFGGHLTISEPDVIEFNHPGAARSLRLRGLSDFYRRIEQFEDAFAGGHRRLQDVVLFTQVLNGTEEALRVLNEGCEDADGDRAFEVPQSTEPNH